MRGDGGHAQHVGQKAHELMALAREDLRPLREIGIIGEKVGVMFRHHAAAGARGRDNVIAVGEGVHGLQGEGARIGSVAGIEGGLAAAGLRGHGDLAARILQQLHGGEADAGAKEIDETGDEEADAWAVMVRQGDESRSGAGGGRLCPGARPDGKRRARRGWPDAGAWVTLH